MLTESCRSVSGSLLGMRAADVLVPERARVDRHEQGPEVLNEQRDADREPVDREEVEELNERDSADAEHGEPQHLAAAQTQCAR